MTRQEIQELEQRRKEIKDLLENDKLSNKEFLEISMKLFGIDGKIRRAYAALERLPLRAVKK